jgi:hypothetical protein
MGLIAKHAVLTAVATVVGLAGVFWIRPRTSAGTILIMTICFIIFNAIGAIRTHKP